MGNKAGLIRAVLILLFIAGFGWLVLRPHEPVWHGKPLTYWLEQAYESDAYQIDGAAPEAEQAVQELGTAAVPHLVHWLRSVDYVPERIMEGFAGNSDLVFLHLPQMKCRKTMVPWAFKRLGAKAKPAVPELIQTLSCNDDALLSAAVRCLGAIGPSSQPAVPALIAAWHEHPYVQDDLVTAFMQIGPGASAALPCLESLTNEPTELIIAWINRQPLEPVMNKLKSSLDPPHWGFIVRRIGEIGKNAEPFIPDILSAMNSTNKSVRLLSITLLGQIHSRPETCVPALVQHLSSNDSVEQYWTLFALGSFGKDARAASADIVRCLSNREHSIARVATNALQVVDPEAAAKAGIAVGVEPIKTNR